MRLQDKVAVITGGARGLGQAMAELFVKEGAKVIAADMGDLAYENPNVEGYKLNVADGEACKAFVDYVTEKYGKIDILVNNAGITRDALTRKMTDEMWDLVIDVNLKGVFNLTRHVGPQMQANGKGSIINISSVVGEFGNIGQANYAATKAGVIGMTKTCTGKSQCHLSWLHHDRYPEDCSTGSSGQICCTDHAWKTGSA